MLANFCWNLSWKLFGKVQLDQFSGYLHVTKEAALWQPTSLRISLKWGVIPAQEFLHIFVIAKFCPVFLTALSSLHSLQQLSRKDTSKMKGIILMWIFVFLKNTRRSPVVCRCPSKGNENLLKKSFGLESNLMWTKTEYTISPTQLYFQWAFSMSSEKLEWEQETEGREIRVLHTSWILFSFFCTAP